jgi:hypothetical protein
VDRTSWIESLSSYIGKLDGQDLDAMDLRTVGAEIVTLSFLLERLDAERRRRGAELLQRAKEGGDS